MADAAILDPLDDDTDEPRSAVCLTITEDGQLYSDMAVAGDDLAPMIAAMERALADLRGVRGSLH